MIITAYTRPGCPHCERARSLLDERGLEYRSIDVTASEALGHEAVVRSGRATVPQVFFGSRFVGGADELAALAGAGRLEALVAAAETDGGQADGPVDDSDAQALANAAENVKLTTVVPELDPVHPDDPEQLAILHHFKAHFGFLPNSAYVQSHWPEAYKLYSYCHYFHAEAGSTQTLGKPLVMAAAFTTSDAHGCDYCRVHTSSMGGDASRGTPARLDAAREGKASADDPVGPFELALANLAANATTNTVDEALLEEIERLAPMSRGPSSDASECVDAVAMLAAAFGFLNVFNDLLGVEIEREWAHESERESGIDSGRHGVSEDRASDNLDHELPDNGPSEDEMVGRSDRRVAEAGGAEAYVTAQLNLVPAWMQAWPDATRGRHALLYCEVMQSRPHSSIPSELKHLMARVAATATDHDSLAAVEGWLAWQAGGADDEALERVCACWAAATGRPEGQSPFSARERAALRFAWLSAQRPMVLPRAHVQPALDAYSPAELVQLSFVCGIASLVQRFAAVARPALEPQVRHWMARSALALDSLEVRHPRTAAGTSAAGRDPADERTGRRDADVAEPA